MSRKYYRQRCTESAALEDLELAERLRHDPEAQRRAQEIILHDELAAAIYEALRQALFIKGGGDD